MTGLSELLRNLPEIKTSETLVVGVVAILAWLAAVYSRRPLPPGTVQILEGYESDKERSAAIAKLLGRGVEIPEQLRPEDILPFIEKVNGYRSKVLVLIGYIFTALVVVMVATMLFRSRGQQSSETNKNPITSTVTAAVETSATMTTRTAAPPPPPGVSDLASAVRGGSNGTDWPDATLGKLADLSKRKSEITADVRERLLSEATQGEDEIRALLKTSGAPSADFKKKLENLIRVHQAIANVAGGQTTSWKETAKLIQDKRPLIAEEMNLTVDKP